jgi:uncharacterized NAD(P)/FAD-binding protein YdhS
MAPRAPSRRAVSTVAVVGGGFSGTLFALKLARQRADLRIYLIEKNALPGRGLAYGACSPFHLLNVPVNRMEVGLAPAFAEWLVQKKVDLSDALAESGGDLASSFVSRQLFGDYLEERLQASLSGDRASGVVPVRGDVVRLMDAPQRGVVLHDGRELAADAIVLATGNLAPRAPAIADDWLYDTPWFVADPWTHDAFDRLDRSAPVLLLGAGLTMVDVALKLADSGHRGKMHSISRHGLLPKAHRAGGAWEPFLKPHIPSSPLKLSRIIRAEVRKAEAAGVPWQRVIDAVRPSIASAWHAWSGAERHQFLRHLRSRWDVHRHRMAPRIADALAELLDSNQLHVSAGRIREYRKAPGFIEAVVARRGARDSVISAARVINCTGPRSDFARLALPLFADMKKRGFIVPDAMDLGLESSDCALIDRMGRPLSWLFALGPLTRPAWWEVTAVPEIALQIDRLVADISRTGRIRGPAPPLLAEAFVDLGAGI